MSKGPRSQGIGALSQFRVSRPRAPRVAPPCTPQCGDRSVEGLQGVPQRLPGDQIEVVSGSSSSSRLAPDSSSIGIWKRACWPQKACRRTAGRRRKRPAPTRSTARRPRHRCLSGSIRARSAAATRWTAARTAGGAVEASSSPTVVPSRIRPTNWGMTPRPPVRDTAPECGLSSPESGSPS